MTLEPNRVFILDWSEEVWPSLPASWPIDAECTDEGCGCQDLEPLVTRIAASMARLGARRVYRWGAAQYVVQRERQVLYTGSEFRWTVRDRTLERDYLLELEVLSHPDGPLLGSFDTHERALDYVVQLLDDRS